MAITFVVSDDVSSGGVNGSTTPGVDTTGADLIVLGITYNDGSTASVSDSKSNTWSALTIRDSTGAVLIRLYYCLAPTVGTSHTFTVSGTGTYSSIAAVAFAGATGGFDQESGASDVTQPTASPGSLTPAENGEVLVAFWGGFFANYDSVDGSFTTVESDVGNAGTDFSMAISYLIQTTAAAANPVFTATGGGEHVAAMACFKATAAGGTVTGPIIGGALVFGRKTVGGG